MHTDDEIAKAYLRYQKFSKDSDWWAWKYMDDLVNSDPVACWRLICILVERAESDLQLAYVAAGPLEDLLKWHGEEFISQVVETALSNEKLQLALSGVWLRPFQSSIWSRWSLLMDEFGFRDGRRSPL